MVMSTILASLFVELIAVTSTFIEEIEATRYGHVEFRWGLLRYVSFYIELN